LSTSGAASRESSQGFGAARRLHRKAEFDAVYREGLRSVDALFAVIGKPNSAGFARLGLSIGARAAGNAVARNRIKRLTRESFRLHHATLPALDIVVNARHGVSRCEAATIRDSLEQHWRAIAKRCATS
jgi:ribonuclease P protein component